MTRKEVPWVEEYIRQLRTKPWGRGRKRKLRTKRIGKLRSNYVMRRSFSQLLAYRENLRGILP
jgi:hypothetical protein